MAGHARLRGGDPRKRRFLDGRVAVAAIDSQLARMVPMAERDGLLPLDILLRVPRRHRDRIQRVAERAKDDHRAINGQPRDEVRAAMKYLWHRLFKSFLL